MKPIMLLSVAPESTHLPDEPFFLILRLLTHHAIDPTVIEVASEVMRVSTSVALHGASMTCLFIRMN